MTSAPEDALQIFPARDLMSLPTEAVAKYIAETKERRQHAQALARAASRQAMIAILALGQVRAERDKVRDVARNLLADALRQWISSRDVLEFSWEQGADSLPKFAHQMLRAALDSVDWMLLARDLMSLTEGELSDAA